MNDLINKLFDDYRMHLKSSSERLGFDSHDYASYYKFRNVSILKINSEIFNMYNSGREFGSKISEENKPEIINSLGNFGSNTVGIFSKSHNHSKDLKNYTPIIKDIVNEAYNAYLLGVKDAIIGNSKQEFTVHDVPIKKT